MFLCYYTFICDDYYPYINDYIINSENIILNLYTSILSQKDALHSSGPRPSP